MKNRFEFEKSVMIVIFFDVVMILFATISFILIDSSVNFLINISPHTEWQAWAQFILNGFYSFVAASFSIILGYQSHRILKQQKRMNMSVTEGGK